MHDLDHPLDAYTHLATLHAKSVSEYFEALVRKSGVDERENARLVAEVRALESEIAGNKNQRNGWWFAGGTGLAVAATAVVVALSLRGAAYLLLLPAVGAILFNLSIVRSRLSLIRSQLQDLELQRDAKRGEAWAQMEPLNRLHTWNVAPALFEATFPAVKFDGYVHRARVGDLISTYGLPPDFGSDRSAIFSQSGSLTGNPLVFQRSLHHWMGSRSYSGSLAIHWTERTRDANGNYVNVQRSQTLSASVIKPYPEFREGTALIYGHESVPMLSFGRGPSLLFGLAEGRTRDWLKNRKIKKVARQARRQVARGSGQLTVMANRDFEALFNATNRDDELAFRLLFTPLAQQEMVKLLNDRALGYGDDFSFVKVGAINVVEPSHLNQTRLDGDPTLFHSIDLADARRFFNGFHTDYFRSLYFSLAPLLTVPLYREKRSIAEPDSQFDGLEACDWEHEAMANLLGDASFKHSESITRNLLKTTSTNLAPGVALVEVTAFGYGGIPRIDYVSVRGRDGNVHEVPVHWTEYFQVQRERNMLVGVVESPDPETEQSQHATLGQNWNLILSHYAASAAHSVARGPLVAVLLND